MGQTQGGREERRRIGKQVFIVTLGLRVQTFQTSVQKYIKYIKSTLYQEKGMEGVSAHMIGWHGRWQGIHHLHVITELVDGEGIGGSMWVRSCLSPTCSDQR